MRQSTRVQNKGQIQMGEMVIIMVIFFAIVGIGIVFFTQFSNESYVSSLSDQQQQNLAETAKLVKNMPEIHCSIADFEDSTCIDMIKVRTFARTMESDERLHYSNIFAGYRANLECVYPKAEQPNNCSSADIDGTYTFFDYTSEEAKNVYPFLIPVIIYNPLTGGKAFGILTIEQKT